MAILYPSASAAAVTLAPGKHKAASIAQVHAAGSKDGVVPSLLPVPGAVASLPPCAA